MNYDPSYLESIVIRPYGDGHMAYCRFTDPELNVDLRAQTKEELYGKVDRTVEYLLRRVTYQARFQNRTVRRPRKTNFA